MESFCGGKEFWNINLTWNEKRSWPEFTECFQNTVLVWISSGWLWLTAPIYITYLLKSPSDPLPRSWRHIAQMTLAALQVVIIIVELSYGGSELRDKGKTFWQAYFIGPLIEGLTLLLVFVYIELERRKGFITSGVLFIYWLLACLTFIIPFYTEIIKEGYNEFLLGFLCFNLYYAASLIQLILSCIAERLPDTPGKQPCPEIQASFLSRMTFTWINKLVVLGFKRPITEDDMFMLNPREQSRNVIPKFERKWKAEVKKVYRSGIRARLKTDKVYVNANGGMAGCELSESTPLLQGTCAKGASAENKEKKESKEQKISLAKVLVKTYWWEFLRSNIWKLFYDALLFANPFLLQLLIEFAEDFTKPDWMGYIMASGFLAIIFLQSFCFHQLMFQSINLGLRVRSVLISAIFKKALTMNNKARTESTVGEIVNLMSVDCQHLADLSSYLWAAWSSPLQIIAALIFLYYTVGVAMFAGLGVMVVLLPFNGFITAKVGKYQKQQMAKKDERLKLMNEILNGIKILKLYAWELAFGNKVMAVRTEELRILRKQAIVNAFFTFSWTVAPFTVGLATFAVYIFTKDDHRIDAQTAFVAITLFNILRFAVLVAPIMVMELVKTFVSIKRIGKYLNHEDLDLSMVMHSSSDVAISINRGTFGWDSQIGPCLRDINLRVPKGSLIAVVGSVGSGKSSLVSATLGEMEKLGGQVNVDGSIAYVPQQAWIQNMTVRNNILFGNPMNASKYEKIIEACALQSDLDILPAKDMTEIGEKGINLSGGQKQRVSLARAVYFDADIYLLDDPLSAVDAHVGKHIFEKLIGSEGLLKNKTRVLVTHGIHWLPSVDVIVVMDNGKISEVGSYEQLMAHDGAFAQFLRTYLVNTESDDESDNEDQEIKTTILKRLVSIQSDISDDIKEVIKRQQSKTSESKSWTHSESDQGHHSVKPKSRTRSESEQKSDSESTYKLLKRQLSRPEHSDAEHSDHLKLMRQLSYKSGSDTEHSPSKQDKVKSSKSVDIARQTSKVDTVLETDPSAQLIEEEELEIGRVRWGVLIAYGRAVGLPFVLIIFLLYGAYQGFSVWANIWLTDWTSDSDLQNLTAYPGDSQDRRDKNDYYLTIYGVLGIAQAVMVVCYSVTALVRMIRATGVLHEKMLRNILRGPMSFFDTTPIGRIVNRFSQDIESIDLKIPQSVESFLDCLFVVISTLVIIVYSTPIFASIIVPLMLVYLAIQRFYIPTSRQLKRLESKARSPIYNHFSETLTGASIIRAYGVQKRFALESEKRVDHNQTYYFSSVTVNRWLGFRLEILGGFVVGIAAIFAVLERSNISGSLVGLSISYALQITDNLNWLVRMVSELETNIVSVERVQQYTVTPVEAPLKTNRRPPHFWPEHGVVKLENYCVRYREGLDLVLKGISIHINSGEKIGIVGRTGAGKSSLTLSLFRLIEPAGGKIIIDGEDITKLGLYDLRAKLTILPQEPVLFSGTLRMNLDPLFEYSDNELWRVLEHAHLKSYVESLPTGLEYECGEGGQNLSVGQRQLMCLARSLLRKSKILILDEATAAVDMETDELIQKTINTEFQDCTVLTIAHRLNTVIDYDRILVLDKGVVKEFDKPDTLLTNTDSIFYGMAKDAGLVS